MGDFLRMGFAAYGLLAATLLVLVPACLFYRRRAATLGSEAARWRDFAAAAGDWRWQCGGDLVVEPAGSGGEALEGRRLIQLLDDSPDSERHLEAIAAHQPLAGLQCRVVGSRGELRWIELSGRPVFGLASRFLGYRGIGRDVTRAVETRRAAEDSEARFLRAIEHRTDGMVYWDADDRFVMCNSVYREQSGAAAYVLVPGTPYETYMRESLRLGEVPHAVGQEEAWLAERLARHRHPSGPIEIFRGEHWLLLHEVRTPDGGTLISATDITELKAREAELQRAKSQAEVASEAKTSFLAVMSHELRTPLNAVLGFAELLASEVYGPLNDRQRDYLEDIQTAGRHLLSVINDILDMSKIEAGRYEPDESDFEVAPLVTASLAIVRGRAEEVEVSLRAEPVMPQLSLHADQRAIKQVLVNLLSNAIKFSGPGSTVTVSARRDGEGDLLLAVKDHGVGIEADLLKQVFEPFQQGDARISRRYGGTGLGLAISKRLVEHHGGRIDLDSEVGVGTVATVRLPAMRVTAAAS